MTADPYLVNLVHELAYLDSVARIGERLRERAGVDRGGLARAVAQAVSQEADAGRPRSARLLAHAGRLADDLLAVRVPTNDGADAGPVPPPVLAALTAASTTTAATTALSAVRALAEVRELLTDDVLDALTAMWFPPSHGSGSAPVDEGVIRLYYLATLVAGRAGPRVDALLIAARVRSTHGRDRAAGVLYRRAAAVAEDDVALRITVLSAWARWLHNQGLPDDAVDALRECLRLRDDRDGPVGRVRALSDRIALAHAYESAGRGVEAVGEARSTVAVVDEVRALMQRAGALTDAQRASLDGYELSLRLLLAQALLAVGDPVAAETEALWCSANAGGQTQAYERFRAETLLARIAAGRFDDRAAEAAGRRAVRISEAAGLAGQTASALVNLGDLQLEAGRYRHAQASFTTAIWHAGNAGSPPYTVALAISGIGRTVAAEGKAELAHGLHLRALESAREADDADLMAMLVGRLAEYPGWWAETGADAVRHLIALPAAAQRPDMLVQLTTLYAHRSVAAGERDAAVAMLRAQSARLAEARGRPSASLHHELAIVLAGTPDTAAEGRDLLLGLVDQARDRIDGADPVRRSEVVAGLARVNIALVDVLVARGDALPDEPDPTGRAFDVHEAAKGRSLAAALGPTGVAEPSGVPDDGPSPSPSPSATGDEPVTVPELRALMDGLGQPVALASFFCADDWTACFLLRPGAALEVVRVPVGWSTWEEAGRRMRRLINGAPGEWPPYPPIRGGRPWARELDMLDRIGAALEELLAPVLADDVALLCVAPHGPLHGLPLHAARLRDGRHLLERCGVTYTPSLTSLRAVLAAADRRGPAGPSATALVAGVAAGTDLRPEHFETDELPTIGVPTTTLRGPADVTPRTVVDELPRHDVVHLTCHGIFDPLRPLHSGLLLGDGTERPPRALSSVAPRHRPRFLLDAETLLGIRMRARVVSLRACSSGQVGHRHRGDELDGLTRSFLQAGASTVIAGLWNVDQRSSRTMLDAFYRGWWHDGGPATRWEALRAAQLEMLHSDDEARRHPYHWAALALVGDFR